MSARTPPTLETGAEKNTPAKNRVMNIVCKFSAVAVAALKHIAIKYGARTESFRPYNSDIGANSTGPNAKPRMNNDSPNVVTKNQHQKAQLETPCNISNLQLKCRTPLKLFQKMR